MHMITKPILIFNICYYDREQQNHRASGICDLAVGETDASVLGSMAAAAVFSELSRCSVEISDEIVLLLYFILENSCMFVLPEGDDTVSW